VNVFINHKFFLGGALLFFAAFSFAAFFLHQPLMVFVPLLFVGAFYLLQYPLLLLFLLIAAIPWSAEMTIGTFGTDLPDEPLMLLLSFAALALFASKKEPRKDLFHPLLLLLLAQMIWIGFTVLTSTDVVLSAKYLLAKSWYLLAFVAAPLLMQIDQTAIKRIALVLCISMGLVTMVTIVRHAAFGFRFDAINDALTPFFRNHVAYSALLAFTLPLQVAFLAGQKRHRGWLYFFIILTLTALYFSYSRGAWLSIISGGLSYWLLKKKWLTWSYVIGLLLMIALVFWLKKDERYVRYAHDYQTTIFHEDLSEHLVATYKMNDVSAAERFYRWIAGVRMVKDNWKTGIGPNTFYKNYKSYTVPAYKTWISKNEEQSTVHNYFLLQLVEQGIIGLLLFSVLVGAMLFYAQRIYHRAKDIFWRRTAAVISALLVMICTLNLLSDLIETDKVGSVFYLCVAVLVVADRKSRSDAASHIQSIP
jgi:O-antigen ligase